MSNTREQRDRVLAFYDGVSGWMAPGVKSLADQPDAVIASARGIFEGMLDELPYVERPEHVMANSIFASAALLAVFEVLHEQGVDAHAWGRAIHSLPVVSIGGPDDAAGARADAEASQSGAPNEFVFEMVEPDERTDRGMNITACAICHLFGKRDAMELVPYMCAFDDAVSDANGQGLRRTGTIALGASHCDFRFKRGGEPLRVASQYPEKIRLNDA